MKYRFQYSLRSFLIAILGTGMVSGLIGRYWLDHPKYIERIRQCDGVWIQAMFRKTAFSREHMIFLVARPCWTVGASDYSVRDPEWDPEPVGIVTHPRGLYACGELMKSSAGDLIWIQSVLVQRGQARAVPGTAAPDGDLTFAEFDQLERLPIWKDHVLPELGVEFDRFATEWRKFNGSQPLPTTCVPPPAVKARSAAKSAPGPPRSPAG